MDRSKKSDKLLPNITYNTGVQISNCTFSGHQPEEVMKAETSKMCSPAVGDLTHNIGVQITNCTFSGQPEGMQEKFTTYAPGRDVTYNTGVQIINCTFTGHISHHVTNYKNKDNVTTHEENEDEMIPPKKKHRKN